MYQRITFPDFYDAFWHAGRAEQFSYEAKRALFEYLNEREDDTGEKIELDVIALCCEYAESTVDELIDEYDLDTSDCEDDADRCDLVEGFLNDRTTIVWQRGKRFLYQQF